VERLQQTQESWPEEQLLTCLVARTAVSHRLKAGELDDIALMRQLFVADKVLRALSPRIVGFASIPDWRESLQPHGDAWWWFPPEAPSAHWWGRLDWLVNGLTLLVIAVTLSFVADIATRFYLQGFDLVGALTIVLPMLLASLSAGGIFSATISQGMNRVMQHLRIPTWYQYEARFGIAIVIWLVVMAVWFNLPIISRTYSNRGEAARAQGQLADARRDLERAIKLDSDNAVAHYNLGNVYEDLFSAKQAITEYQMAAAAGLDLAYNNLGRLYILAGEYDNAVQELEKALRQFQPDGKPREAETRYNLLKNLGWARVGQQRFNDARSVLEQAIALHPNAAPAYCLLAKVYQEQLASATREGTPPELPYILVPRHTAISDPHPLLQWNAVPGAQQYTIQVIDTRRPGRPIWGPITVPAPPMHYPNDAPTLRPGITYFV
jgi:tetratricopeptide (TPR) repeat protein